METRSWLIVGGIALVVILILAMILVLRVRRRRGKETVTKLRSLETRPSRLGRSAMVMGAGLR
ncbi:MAG: hypothetical protein ACRDZM_19110, partial [Acidimicrobiia bacterium]